MTEKEKIQELEAQLAQRDVLLAQAQRILKSYSMTLSNSNKHNLLTIKMM